MQRNRKCSVCGSSKFLARDQDKCLSCFSSVRRKGELLIGIDPDREKSGVAVLDIAINHFIRIESLSFFDLYEMLVEYNKRISLIRIEGGWLNTKSNFHSRPDQIKTVGERIAKDVGANQEAGKKICEMCDYLKIPYEVVKPLGTKCIDAGLFRKITGYNGRTNPDKRDAAMLVWNLK